MKKFNIPKWDLKKIKISGLPHLRLRQKLLLYFGMILFSGLAIADVVLKLFPYALGIIIYVLAAITLFSGCYYLIVDLKHDINDVVKPAVTANPYVGRLTSDYRLRTFTFAVPGMISNVIFAVFNGVIGIYSHSAWFGSLAAYYILLSLMRISAVRQDRIISKMDDKKERFIREVKIFKKKISDLIIQKMKSK